METIELYDFDRTLLNTSGPKLNDRAYGALIQTIHNELHQIFDMKRFVWTSAYQVLHDAFADPLIEQVLSAYDPSSVDVCGDDVYYQDSPALLKRLSSNCNTYIVSDSLSYIIKHACAHLWYNISDKRIIASDTLKGAKAENVEQLIDILWVNGNAEFTLYGDSASDISLYEQIAKSYPAKLQLRNQKTGKFELYNK